MSDRHAALDAWSRRIARVVADRVIDAGPSDCVSSGVPGLYGRLVHDVLWSTAQGSAAGRATLAMRFIEALRAEGARSISRPISGSQLACELQTRSEL